jgi:hypothetical protein
MDIRRGDFLAELVPALKKADRRATRSSDIGAVYNTASDTSGTVTQSRYIEGDVGTVIKGNQGSIHTGKGDINHSTQHFSGDGATYIQGDNHGGISHRFGRARGDEEER